MRVAVNIGGSRLLFEKKSAGPVTASIRPTNSAARRSSVQRDVSEKILMSLVPRQAVGFPWSE